MKKTILMSRNGSSDPYGPELITEGDFSNGGAAWTLGASVTVVNEEVVVTNGTYNEDLLRQVVSEVGKTYKLEFEIVAGSYVEGGVYVRRPGDLGIGSAVQSEGLHTFTVISIAELIILRSSEVSTNLKLDNVSLKEIL